MKRTALIFLAMTSACQSDETISGYADPQAEFVLETLDGTPFPARATIGFPDQGTVSGQAPCNRYSGAQTAPYPWFTPGPMMATKMACPALAEEQRFFAALNQMTLAEASGRILVLSNDAGREMVFRAP